MPEKPWHPLCSCARMVKYKHLQHAHSTQASLDLATQVRYLPTCMLYIYIYTYLCMCIYMYILTATHVYVYIYNQPTVAPTANRNEGEIKSLLRTAPLLIFCPRARRPSKLTSVRCTRLLGLWDLVLEQELQHVSQLWRRPFFKDRPPPEPAPEAKAGDPKASLLGKILYIYIYLSLHTYIHL